ncbi:hypothetical protein KUV86_11425 [Halomonas sp. DP8Y7-3]|uniref:hypothetical protein n=1 Tax=Halomonas sp. DP8Y7-3 TaxID=2859079 RepID=UPI001C93A53B|nr:hypothetical protein [Halomonas sp. DP8Y7-3]MBY5929717.1 hypothetical protein [Halomonas sp. DP8Y7-3]
MIIPNVQFMRVRLELMGGGVPDQTSLFDLQYIKSDGDNEFKKIQTVENNLLEDEETRNIGDYYNVALTTFCDDHRLQRMATLRVSLFSSDTMSGRASANFIVRW